MAITGVSHIGLCVSDVDRSLDFYCAKLGFTPLTRYRVQDDDQVRKLLELDELDFELAFVERDGLRIELIHFDRPRALAHPDDAFNRLGFTHLSVHVADFDATLASLARQGVAIREATIGRHDASNARFAFCTDPDGNRVELFGAIDESARKPWELSGPSLDTRAAQA